jgi:hypothetical protein
VPQKIGPILFSSLLFSDFLLFLKIRDFFKTINLVKIALESPTCPQNFPIFLKKSPGCENFPKLKKKKKKLKISIYKTNSPS